MNLPEQPTWTAIKCWIDTYDIPEDVWQQFNYFECDDWSYAFLWNAKTGVTVSISLTKATADYIDWVDNFKSLMNLN